LNSVDPDETAQMYQLIWIYTILLWISVPADQDLHYLPLEKSG
jgi:hypothetical protein